MQRSRITITINQQSLENIDRYIGEKHAQHRSQAIEQIVSEHFSSRVKKAVILAGGQGSKMRPFTYEIPKALLPINGQPLLHYMIEKLRRAGVTDIIICVGYLGEQIRNHFGDGKRFGVNIRYSSEDVPLQTGGALLKVRKYISRNPFLVLNGDVISNLNFNDIVDFHVKEEPAVTVGVTVVDDPKNYGKLELHGLQLVNYFPPESSEKTSGLINTGIYVMSPEIFDYFPKNKSRFLFEDVITKLIGMKKANGFFFKGVWFDVGTPETYAQAIKAFK